MCTALCFLQPLAAEREDSLRTQNLQEVVIEGKTAWADGNKLMFIPSKQDKRLSNSIESLLQRMSMPVIRLIDGQIQNTKGASVTVYVNGVKADNMDYATFWPKQTVRVEYMEYPSDPKFNGEACVVNIVTKVSQYGGVAKLNARQEIKNTGKYEGATKLEHRKWTFGLLAKGEYNNDNTLGNITIEKYAGLYLNDTYHSEISSEGANSENLKKEDFDIALNSRYISGKTQITHNLSWRLAKTPHDRFTGHQFWNIAALPGETTSSNASARSSTPQISGKYRFATSSKCNVTAGWKYAYADNTTRYSNHWEGFEPISTATKEHVHNLSANASCSFAPSRLIQVSGKVKTEIARYSTSYTGTDQGDFSQNRRATELTATLWWIPGQKFMMSLTPGMFINSWSGGGDSWCRTSPKGEGWMGWFPSDKFQANISLIYWNTPPPARATNEMTIQSTPILWSQGNPQLRNMETWTVLPSLVWFPAQWLDINNTFSFNVERNGQILSYTPRDEHAGGVLGSWQNCPGEFSFQWDMSLVFKNLFRRLTLAIMPTYGHIIPGYKPAGTLDTFRLRGSASMDVGPVGLTLVYSGAEEWLMNGGTLRGKSKDNWNLSAVYGTGDFFFSLTLDNILRRRSRITTVTENGALTTSTVQFSRGRYLNLSATYTFGYGRKVSRNINIEQSTQVESSIR